MYLRKNLESLLVEHGVNVVLSGHTHRYERTCAVKDGDCVGEHAGGIFHVITGSGGHEISGTSHPDKRKKKYMERSIPKFGFSTVKILSETSAKITFTSVQDDVELLDDSFDVFNPHFSAAKCTTQFTLPKNVSSGTSYHGKRRCLLAPRDSGATTESMDDDGIYSLSMTETKTTFICRHSRGADDRSRSFLRRRKFASQWTVAATNGVTFTPNL